MTEFFEKLYSYEYFGIYLMISIIVLVLLFIIILFFGKKDKKEREIEATKKLQQINNDAFKEDSIIEKVEVNEIQQDLENDTIIVPTIEDVPSILNEEVNEIPEPVLPTQEEVEENNITENPVIDTPVIKEEPIEITETPVEPITEEVIEQPEVTPILERIEEKPLSFNELFVEPVETKVVEEPVIPRPIEEPEEEIEVPTFNFDEIVKSVEETKNEQTYTKGPEIFSSVYAPEKEEVELPKEEVKPVSSINEDLGIELPTLKKEEPKQEEVKNEKIEMPVLNDYNLDELSGETYTIK